MKISVVENLKKGISKPLQEINLSSGDEDSILGMANNRNSDSLDQSSRNYMGMFFVDLLWILNMLN